MDTVKKAPRGERDRHAIFGTQRGGKESASREKLSRTKQRAPGATRAAMKGSRVWGCSPMKGMASRKKKQGTSRGKKIFPASRALEAAVLGPNIPAEELHSERRERSMGGVGGGGDFGGLLDVLTGIQGEAIVKNKKICPSLSGENLTSTNYAEERTLFI